MLVNAYKIFFFKILGTRKRYKKFYDEVHLPSLHLNTSPHLKAVRTTCDLTSQDRPCVVTAICCWKNGDAYVVKKINNNGSSRLSKGICSSLNKARSWLQLLTS